MKSRLAVLSLPFLIASSLLAKNLPLADKVWIVIRPVQCLGNRWEKEWLSKHPHKSAEYPMKKEKDILKNYFSKRGVPILESRMVPYTQGEPVCQTCDCPRGDTFYLLIKASNAPKMVKMGYTERIPANLVPQKK